MSKGTDPFDDAFFAAAFPGMARCVCGEPTAVGVQHRTDGPCFHIEKAPPASKDELAAIAAILDGYVSWCRLHNYLGRARELNSFADRLRAIALRAGETTAPTVIHAEGSRVMMELFNRMPVAALKAVPEDIAKQIGDFMVSNGYRFVFDRWYLQAEPKEPVRPAQKTSVATDDPFSDLPVELNP